MYKEKMKSGLILLIGILAVLFFNVGCADSDNTPADIAEIEQIIKADKDGLFGINFAAEEDSTEQVAGMTKAADEIIPRAYWRRVQIRRTGLNISTIGTDTAIAELTFRMSGVFVIQTRVNAQPVRYFKDLKHTFKRKVRFVRNPADSLTYWRRDALTPAYGISDNGTLQMTAPVNLRILRNGMTTTLTIVDPLTTFIPFNALPAWGPGDVITIEMPVTNSVSGDLPFGTAHRGRLGNVLSRLRTPFRDDGQNGDLTAGDNIYTAQWTAIATSYIGPHIGFIDFFARSTVFTTDAPYNSLALMFPFIKLEE